MNLKIISVLAIGMILTGCNMVNNNESIPTLSNEEAVNELEVRKDDVDTLDAIVSLIDPNGDIIAERIICPAGYERIEEDQNSFAAYLRNSLLKPHGSDVLLFDGRKKRNQSVHVAVLDIDIGDRDLQQCADATMRLWAEYLRSIDQDEKISFEFTNGFHVEYAKWMAGYRIKVEGNDVSWVKTREPSNSKETFMAYMQIIYSYAGTLSLANELESVSVENMQIGDVFVQGGSPGHAVIVVDMVINSDTGEQLFLLAQSYMPAQNIHILRNPSNILISPWYTLDNRDVIITPEWRFTKEDLKRYEY